MVARDDVPLAEVGLAGVLDLHAVHQVVVGRPELELVDHRAGQEAGVADGVDADLAEHLGDDDLEVLVVDLDRFVLDGHSDHGFQHGAPRRDAVKTSRTDLITV